MDWLSIVEAWSDAGWMSLILVYYFMSMGGNYFD